MPLSSPDTALQDLDALKGFEKKALVSSLTDDELKERWHAPFLQEARWKMLTFRKSNDLRKKHVIVHTLHASPHKGLLKVKGHYGEEKDVHHWNQQISDGDRRNTNLSKVGAFAVYVHADLVKAADLAKAPAEVQALAGKKGQYITGDVDVMFVHDTKNNTWAVACRWEASEGYYNDDFFITLFLPEGIIFHPGDEDEDLGEQVFEYEPLFNLDSCGAALVSEDAIKQQLTALPVVDVRYWKGFMDNWDGTEGMDEVINENLDDPFVTGNEGEEMSFSSGSQEQLEARAKMIFWAFWDITDASQQNAVVVFKASDGYDEAGIEREYDWEVPFNEKAEGGEAKEDTLAELMDMALTENSFSGWHLEYNDQARNRLSGYNRDAETVRVEVDDIPSGHELLEARIQLKEWLAEKGWTSKKITNLMQRINNEV